MGLGPWFCKHRLWSSQQRDCPTTASQNPSVCLVDYCLQNILHGGSVWLVPFAVLCPVTHRVSPFSAAAGVFRMLYPNTADLRGPWRPAKALLQDSEAQPGGAMAPPAFLVQAPTSREGRETQASKGEERATPAPELALPLEATTVCSSCHFSPEAVLTYFLFKPTFVLTKTDAFPHAACGPSRPGCGQAPLLPHLRSNVTHAGIRVWATGAQLEGVVCPWQPGGSCGPAWGVCPKYQGDKA